MFRTQLPTNTQNLDNILRGESSISRLPEAVQESAVKILDFIHGKNMKGTPLRATELRKEVIMDTHRFCRIFKWLQDHKYCRVNAAKRGNEKLVSVTDLGEAVLSKLGRLGRVRDLAAKVCRFPTKNSRAPINGASTEMDLVLDLIVEAFDLAHTEFYYGGVRKIEDYEVFARGLEERVRERLYEDMEARSESRPSFIPDVMFSIRKIPLEQLLEDARLARSRGHFLTQNHRYVLLKFEGKGTRLQAVDCEKKLVDHNVQWKDKIMSRRFNGSEPHEKITSLIYPHQILERERKERATFYANRLPLSLLPARDGYNSDKRWEPDSKQLEARWDKAKRERSRKILGHVHILQSPKT